MQGGRWAGCLLSLAVAHGQVESLPPVFTLGLPGSLSTSSSCYTTHDAFLSSPLANSNNKGQTLPFSFQTPLLDVICFLFYFIFFLCFALPLTFLSPHLERFFPTCTLRNGVSHEWAKSRRERGPKAWVVAEEEEEKEEEEEVGVKEEEERKHLIKFKPKRHNDA